MNFKDIGKVVSDSRKLKGLNQEDAAELCGISHRNYNGVERGAGEASIKTYNKVAKGLDTHFSLDFPTDE